jgi:hypothetical protein
MIDRAHKLSVVRQAKLLGFSRGSSIILRVQCRTAIWR